MSHDKKPATPRRAGPNTINASAVYHGDKPNMLATNFRERGNVRSHIRGSRIAPFKVAAQ